jgi:hypothetical protein
VPSDEDGNCNPGTHPVTTDALEIYDMMAEWNVEGTYENRYYTNPWVWYKAGVIMIGGEGQDEFANY